MRNRCHSVLFLLVVFGTISCQSSLQPTISSPAPVFPPIAAQPDTSIEINGLRLWYLIDDSMMSGMNTIACTVSAPEGIRKVHAHLQGRTPIQLHKNGTEFSGGIGIEDLGPGDHEVRFTLDDSDTAFAWSRFKRSYPLYIVVSNDWESADNSWLSTSNESLELQELLHAKHAQLRLTHLVGPYTFTAKSITAQRKEFLVDWHKRMIDVHQDEVGLHLHPRCDFLSAIGVECLTTPSYNRTGVDTTGYSVCLPTYPIETFRHLVRAADSLFVNAGFGKPLSFRAPGWMASHDHLQVLAEAGFRVDASGCNWRRIEPPPDTTNAILYRWLRENWANISDTSQPYYPPLTAGESILEVPDNGLLVDQMPTASSMIEVFMANWDGKALVKPRQVTFGFHPQSFGRDYYERLDTVLVHVEQFLASRDRGPVRYATLKELAEVW